MASIRNFGCDNKSDLKGMEGIHVNIVEEQQDAAIS
jgi:hypothetical protein